MKCCLDVLMFVALMQRMSAEEERGKSCGKEDCLYPPELGPGSKSDQDAIGPFPLSLA